MLSGDISDSIHSRRIGRKNLSKRSYKNMPMYIETQNEVTDKLLHLVSEFTKAIRYQVRI
jgi:hypothetical protein